MDQCAAKGPTNGKRHGGSVPAGLGLLSLDFGLGVQCFRVLGFRVWGLGFRGLGFRGLGLRV